MGSLKDMFNTNGVNTSRIKPGASSNTPKGAEGSKTHNGSYRLNKARLDVKKAREEITKKEGKRDQIIEDKKEALEIQAAAEKELAIYDKAQILLQKTSDFARHQIKNKIEDIVSQALNVVYGGDHKFIVELDVKGNRPVAAYYLDDGTTITKLEKPDYDRGGGKVGIISLALRLAISEIKGVQGPIFLDEVGKHVDNEAILNVAYFLKEFSSKFNKQIILITHEQALSEIGEVSIEVEKKKGESEVKVI